MNLDLEFKLSLYEELKLLHKSNKVKIFLVQNMHDDKIYIKKEIREYTKSIYESIKNIKDRNIPQIFEVLEMEDKLIVIEEFINGNTLQSILEKQNKLDEEVVIRYMISLCNILHEIHSLNPPIIHRDIKPSNIIISNDNVLKLIDFDISRTYKEGENLDTTLLGTKGYASPEQFGFNQTDCRSDIYAMGIMMNVLTTGKHVKEEENKTLLKDVIKKCTHISPEDRYQNVLDLKKELEEKIHIKYENKYDRKIMNTSVNESIKKEEHILKQIPGFRRGKLRYMILSTLLYSFLIFALFIAKNVKELLENITMVIMMLSMFFLYTNFLDINKRLPLIRSKDKKIRICGYWLYSIIIFFIFGGILTYLGV